MDNKKQLIRKLHTLLAKAGIDSDGKATILAAYDVSSSKDLSCDDLNEICDKLNDLMGGSKHSDLDKMRKCVMRAIFHNLELKRPGETFGVEYVKQIACRAAQCDNFNKIDINALRGIYSAFCRQNKAYDNVVENCEMQNMIIPRTPIMA